MKTLSEIKNEVAKDRGFKNWEAIYTAGGYEYNQKRIGEVAKRYAEEAIKECAKKAFANNDGPSTSVNQDSILNIIKDLK